jgi:hypothetical protein
MPSGPQARADAVRDISDSVVSPKAKRSVWLSITPEPEQELPAAVATLRAGAAPGDRAVADEARRIERLITRSGQRRWLGYLHGVLLLTEAHAGSDDPAVRRAAARAAAVLCNHHNLLLALPGAGAQVTAADRARLDQLAPSLNS